MPTLVEKIAAICKSIDPVLKEGTADAGFAYLRILDLANALREKLFDAGILIVPNDVECVVERWESEVTDRHWSSARVKTEFTFSNAERNFSVCCYGYARDLDGHCVSIAQTMALKSLLKRLGLIFGEYDDPEKQQDDGYSLNLEQGQKAWGDDIREWPISRGEVIAFNAAALASGHTKKGISTYLDAVFGHEKPSELRRREFKEAMAWAGATGESPNVTP
jgi:hypothetical protein